MSALLHFLQAGGFFMWPLLLLSIGAVAVIIERILAFKTLGYLAPGLLQKTIVDAQNDDFSAALQRCETTSGPLAASLAAILKHRDRPVAVAERQVEEVGQEFFLRLERLLPFLDTTTTISPLLGLLGTISGMIGTFNAIAAQKTRENSDAILAGVGEALYATAMGIGVAIVCFVAYNYFAARLRAITGETEQAATRLINVLVDVGHFAPGEAK